MFRPHVSLLRLGGAIYGVRCTKTSNRPRNVCLTTAGTLYFVLLGCFARVCSSLFQAGRKDSWIALVVHCSLLSSCDCRGQDILQLDCKEPAGAAVFSISMVLHRFAGSCSVSAILRSQLCRFTNWEEDEEDFGQLNGR